MFQDTQDIRERIFQIITRRGPSLPVHVAKETNLSILFASAFLSELASGKTIKISDMKVGGSPLYFAPGQEPLLENFSSSLKSKEKDAFLLLKEKKFLKDREQEPAIRVALRSIKDFAIPFKKNEEIYWRYLTIPETEFKEPVLKQEIKVKQKEIEIPLKQPIKKEPKEEPFFVLKKEPKEKPLLIIKEKPKVKQKEKQKKKTQIRGKTNEKFFNTVKEYLTKESYEITDIISFNKNEFLFAVQKNEQKLLAVAYNKKRITMSDIVKIYRKSLELNMPYIILGKGEITKKMKEFIDAAKNLLETRKI